MQPFYWKDLPLIGKKTKMTFAPVGWSCIPSLLPQKPPQTLRNKGFSGHCRYVNDLHLPTTQCACADFGDFAKQRNGDSSREKDL
jgi:hypothetical protein